MDASDDSKFPCAIELHVPLPTPRLASTALKALRVDPELSPFVQRHLSVIAAPDSPAEETRILKVEYKATTNRMLRVAVNSFMDGLKLVLEVMEQLDVDVLAQTSGHQSVKPS
ncbi:hypothetical protein PT974_08970 [Cladobotryum mycophilum]|uniref:Transcription factor Pcc1 n=1 Tax=Cladobotryum mycophilum TaxID=491253 RepID=A0ABR0SF19_9HYPO